MPRHDRPEPSGDWQDWQRRPDVYRIPQSWRWQDSNIGLSEQRLGQRVYITACLLWATLHDRRTASQLRLSNPNWAAVASYYSTVHALRLFWFVVYGSYPTGHAEMARALAGSPRRSSARANWGEELGLGRDTAEVTSAALQSAVRDGLNRADLADQMPLVGKAFEAAKELRNDSNYESLVLAHQYVHGTGGPDFVDVVKEFGRATAALEAVNRLALTFVAEVTRATFDGGADWFCPAARYPADELARLTAWCVRDKIEERDDSPGAVADWTDGLGRLGDSICAATEPWVRTPPALPLRHVRPEAKHHAALPGQSECGGYRGQDRAACGGRPFRVVRVGATSFRLILSGRSVWL